MINYSKIKKRMMKSLFSRAFLESQKPIQFSSSFMKAFLWKARGVEKCDYYNANLISIEASSWMEIQLKF